MKLNNNIYTNESHKANIFNKYFQSQTILDETNAVPLDLASPVLNSELNTIVLTVLEVESVFKTLTVGKTSGPNGLKDYLMIIICYLLYNLVFYRAIHRLIS